MQVEPNCAAMSSKQVQKLHVHVLAPHNLMLVNFSQCQTEHEFLGSNF